ncbi:MAG: hypothetical protein KatS3mg110_4025 [Pirellulaceae bacterium]|nr:MAG: hypothetical protein KatS3mg110_4025 [Pirellulaceae bacterium]
MSNHRIFSTPFAGVYPHYVQKAERKNRTQAEVDQIICWLTGYTPEQLHRQIEQRKDFRTFFAEAPAMNPNRLLIKGVVCGVRVEQVEDPLMREIRYLDKLIDELAKGKPMEKILRTPDSETQPPGGAQQTGSRETRKTRHQPSKATTRTKNRPGA